MVFFFLHRSVGLMTVEKVPSAFLEKKREAAGGKGKELEK